MAYFIEDCSFFLQKPNKIFLNLFDKKVALFLYYWNFAWDKKVTELDIVQCLSAISTTRTYNPTPKFQKTKFLFGLG